MTQFIVLNVDQVIALQDGIIASNELQGLAKDKSLDAVLDRVHNRLRFGFITDVYDLAACYATFIAKGHCFNDANKRTATADLFYILAINDIEIDFTDLTLAQWIIDVATDQKSEVELATWLRDKNT
jgi:death-on-curing protein